MAKDVATFLAWAAEPTQDERKLQGVKTVFAVFCAALASGYYKRFKWNAVKTQKIAWVDEIKRSRAAKKSGL